MTIAEIVKEEAARHGIPQVSESDVDFIVWEHTGYPCWWHIPKDGATPEECLRKQVKDFFDQHQCMGG